LFSSTSPDAPQFFEEQKLGGKRQEADFLAQVRRGAGCHAVPDTRYLAPETSAFVFINISGCTSIFPISFLIAMGNDREKAG
jgi:hypothetical protein